MIIPTEIKRDVNKITTPDKSEIRNTFWCQSGTKVKSFYKPTSCQNGNVSAVQKWEFVNLQWFSVPKNGLQSALPIFPDECELFAHERGTNCGDERPLVVRNCSGKRRKNKKMVGHLAQKLETGGEVFFFCKRIASVFPRVKTSRNFAGTIISNNQTPFNNEKNMFISYNGCWFL